MRTRDPWDELASLDELPDDEPADPLAIMPEIKPYLREETQDDDIGLRSLLEQPEALSKYIWRRHLPA
ncbi:hypothetical protein LZC95_28590 [Pendulispora brunnea]|uniref:Uncharacterized protein n=1 Tax=Pendulispora brunnea TaxID=2905690 RepID=A0ABZ2JXC0_9BACT